MTQIGGRLLILCHQRHDFQLKMHIKGLIDLRGSSQRSTDHLDGLAGGAPEGRGGRRNRKGLEGKDGHKQTAATRLRKQADTDIKKARNKSAVNGRSYELECTHGVGTQAVLLLLVSPPSAGE